jgi:hypothetical protein
MHIGPKNLGRRDKHVLNTRFRACYMPLTWNNFPFVSVIKTLLYTYHSHSIIVTGLASNNWSPLTVLLLHAQDLTICNITRWNQKWFSSMIKGITKFNYAWVITEKVKVAVLYFITYAVKETLDSIDVFCKLKCQAFQNKQQQQKTECDIFCLEDNILWVMLNVV